MAARVTPGRKQRLWVCGLISEDPSDNRNVDSLQTVDAALRSPAAIVVGQGSYSSCHPSRGRDRLPQDSTAPCHRAPAQFPGFAGGSPAPLARRRPHAAGLGFRDLYLIRG